MWYQRKQQFSSKYGNQKREFNGRIYHSIKEANYAGELELRRRAGELQEIIPQFRVSLDVNGLHICNYIVDFKVITKDGSVELHEVKGFETDIYRMKRLLLEATYLKEHPDIKYIVIK